MLKFLAQAAPGAPQGLPQTSPQQLLSELRDLALPSAPSWWPPAPGWWILLLLLSIGIALFWRWYKQRSPKPVFSPTEEIHRTARSELQAVRESFFENQDPVRLAADLSALLRRVAMTLEDREKVASLMGSDWLEWLAGRAGKDLFSDKEGRALLYAHYQNKHKVDGEQLLQRCEQWIECVFVKSESDDSQKK